jgi:hypothetical protein
MDQARNSDTIARDGKSVASGSIKKTGQANADIHALRPAHQRILDAFMTHGTMTPDELAEKIARSVFYTRPRCSELRTMGLLHPTGEVRRNPQSGLKAGVLSI